MSTPVSDRTVTLRRTFDARRERVFRAWTEPELIKLWFAPKPWTTARVEADVRPGGSNLVVMVSPEGQEGLRAFLEKRKPVYIRR